MSDVKTAGELLRKKLLKKGFDGLYNVGDNCCCYLDEGDVNEQCPKECLVPECRAGKIETKEISIITVTNSDDYIPALNIKQPWSEVTK